MPVDFTIKWDRLTGADPFVFSDPYGVDGWDGDDLSITIPSADAPGTDGEYQADGKANARVVTIGGLLDASDPDELRDRWDTLCSALGRWTEGRLYKSSDRFLLCRVASIQRDKDLGFTHLQWTASFRAADPFYQSETVYQQTLSTGGNTLTIGGNYPAKPTFNFVVTHTGTITVTLTVGGVITSFVLTLAATGTYVVDCTGGTIIKDGVTDASASFAGVFPEGVADGNDINIALTNGATVSLMNVQWRRRWISA